MKILKEQRIILSYIIENSSITKNDVIENSLMTEYKFRENLKILQDNGYIEIFGRGRSTRYVLARNSQEHQHLMKQMLKKMTDIYK